MRLVKIAVGIQIGIRCQLSSCTKKSVNCHQPFGQHVPKYFFIAKKNKRHTGGAVGWFADAPLWTVRSEYTLGPESGEADRRRPRPPERLSLTNNPMPSRTGGLAGCGGSGRLRCSARVLSAAYSCGRLGAELEGRRAKAQAGSRVAAEPMPSRRLVGRAGPWLKNHTLVEITQFECSTPNPNHELRVIPSINQCPHWPLCNLQSQHTTPCIAYCL